jgi:hypothetical protein
VLPLPKRRDSRRGHLRPVRFRPSDWSSDLRSNVAHDPLKLGASSLGSGPASDRFEENQGSYRYTAAEEAGPQTAPPSVGGEGSGRRTYSLALTLRLLVPHAGRSVLALPRAGQGEKGRISLLFSRSWRHSARAVRQPRRQQ